MLLYLLVALLTCHTEGSDDRNIPSQSHDQSDLNELRLDLREDMLNLREEMRKLVGDSARSLGDVSRELLGELREHKEASMAREEDVKELQDNLAAALRKLEQVVENQGLLRRRIDVIRSEIRLISQQKLTWQNTTSAERPPDFLVDGVYLRTSDETINPIQHNAAGPNQVVIIDLGGFFKIHTVKIWNRILGQKDRASGLIVYADQTIIGVTSGTRDMYTVKARDEIYARMITLRKPDDVHINLREVQVFGSGPYGDEELA